MTSRCAVRTDGPGNSGYLLNSTDGGTTWNIVDAVADANYRFRETLVSGGKGYIVGSTGLILILDGAKYTPSKTQPRRSAKEVAL
jgi:photosystem II stability/assembly factor-like uncharacterized protein